MKYYLIKSVWHRVGICLLTAIIGPTSSWALVDSALLPTRPVFESVVLGLAGAFVFMISVIIVLFLTTPVQVAKNEHEQKKAASKHNLKHKDTRPPVWMKVNPDNSQEPCDPDKCNCK